MPEIEAYKPDWKNFKNYSKYISYFFEYLKYGDFKSLWASIRYVFSHKLPTKEYRAHSGMGKYLIRKHTTDFQFINYAYEKEIKDFLNKNINEFDVFIDLGACIGEYSIWLAKKGKRCIAVEPVNWDTLVKNIELNGLTDKIKVYKCGVGSKKEKVYFNIPYGVTSSSHLQRDSLNEPNVEIDLLDNIISIENIDENSRILVKMDVEGMEPDAIAGSNSFLKKYKNIQIIYEHFPEDNFRNDKALLEIADFDFDNIDNVNRIATKKQS